jgi:dUTP pyrophosphatase
MSEMTREHDDLTGQPSPYSGSSRLDMRGASTADGIGPLLCERSDVRALAGRGNVLREARDPRGLLRVHLTHGATLPTYGSKGAAAFDLYAPSDMRAEFIDRGSRRFIDTGVSMAIPDGLWGHVLGRSGLARKNGIDVLGGVIDSDYRGTIGVTLLNTGDDGLWVRPGERIAQMVILPCERVTFYEVDALDGTERGANGFGSTGR